MKFLQNRRGFRRLRVFGAFGFDPSGYRFVIADPIFDVENFAPLEGGADRFFNALAITGIDAVEGRLVAHSLGLPHAVCGREGSFQAARRG